MHCNIRTSKSGPTLVCFLQFDFEICCAPQRRALFQHPKLQKWREHVVFCTFWLRNVLRATTTCTFSTSEPPKVAWTCGVLYILTWKCATTCTFSTSEPPKVAREHEIAMILWIVAKSNATGRATMKVTTKHCMGLERDKTSSNWRRISVSTVLSKHVYCNNYLDMWPTRKMRKGMQLRTSTLQQRAGFVNRVMSMATLG